jgi:LytS/YehU family sensor histidine kinase
MIHEDPAAARQMTSDIAAFYRATLTEANRTMGPLREEIRLVARYLAIETHRYDDRLQIEIDLTPEAENVLIPCFIIQPLVENAIKHGMRTSPPPLRVKIASRLEGDVLWIEVANSGSWRHHDGEGAGAGLKNLKERLVHTYRDRFEFHWIEKDGYVRVTLRIDGAAR